MGGTCRMRQGMMHALYILAVNAQGNRPLRKCTHREHSIKINRTGLGHDVVQWWVVNIIMILRVS
jgi:hypothetical protein